MVDETKDMIVLDNGKMVEKKQIAITIGRENKSFTIDGKLLVGRPEDRLNKVASKNE
ncbi:ribonuclease P protein subunit [Candidatus Woesearchaeota archaeon]|nr:ribonuclease P protein subunit [Candidatus Woesearchaeota archaeon]